MWNSSSLTLGHITPQRRGVEGLVCSGKAKEMTGLQQDSVYPSHKLSGEGTEEFKTLQETTLLTVKFAI